MIKQILVAYDGSAPADKAFDYGLELAAKYSAGLYVLAVAQPPEPPDEVETEAMLEGATEHYRQQFEPMRARAAAAGVSAAFEVAVGHPAQQIVDQAEARHVDLIVMGHRGKTFIERWLLGSVSARVINHAHCSVTVVR